MNFENINLTIKDKIANLAFNRPKACNAFNEFLVADVRRAIKIIKENKDIRILIISGVGKHFCGGGDIKWMERAQDYDYEKNMQEMYQISCMFDDIYSLPIPTIAKIKGAAIGGGIGFIAACDIALASQNAVFSLSEAKAGLIPACTTAYLLEKISPNYLRRYFITGEQFGADTALNMGLIIEVCAEENLDDKVKNICESILECGPCAVVMAKELLLKVPQMKYQEFLHYGAEMVAKMRMSAEAREGFLAFIEKRKPCWRNFESENINIKNTDLK